MSRRRALLALLVASPWPQAWAHGDEAASTHAHAITGSDSDVLTVVGPWELTGLDPSRAGYMFARMEVVQTLLEVDDAGQLQAGLATAWQVSADGLQWRFALARGRRYHDGSEVTPASILACLQRAAVLPGVLQLAGITAMTVQQSDLVVSLRQPFGPLPYLLTHYSTQILAPASFDARGKVVAILGSGPFRIKSISLPQQFDVERVEGGAGRAVRRARYISVSRAETRTLLVQSGQADLAFSLDPPSIRALQNSPHAVLLSAMLPRTTILKLNAGHPFLADVRVRRAISLGIEREGIARALLRDADLGATQLLPPSLARWHDARLPPLHTDLRQARRLLEEAGWRLGADGARWKDGQKLQLSLITFVDRPELPLIATALQEEMRQIGIAVRVQIGNSSDIPAGHRSGQLQMALAARNYGNLPDPVASLLQDFGPQGGDWGAMGWHDGEVPALLARLAALPSGDANTGRAERERIVAVLQAQLPVIPVLWYRQTCAVSGRLRGASIDPFERSYRIASLQWT
ncbi:ABC transporter substrate-binding protein [Herbaspirillum sp. C9C3]|uniref:ABC transporter substrate-binding protein n=1 Tax=Herbaspirillum sp. C9C3 TaxID=2735271 RepID=UPI0015844A8F|nr:ABC transporter substrate-binding protein [Herbaspirillum sp. C9C3]NUT60577.1 ABC transporter substrate-binding protein [Herbaspirillum sp. C9C3]